MVTNSNSDYPLAPVQFSRLAKRGIMLGLSLPQLIVLGIAVLTVVFALYTAGGMGFAWTTPIWGTCALLAVIPAGGRKVIEWVPILARWAARTYLGQLVYRRRVIKPRPAGTLALPGDAASLREWEDPETGAAMIHDPHAQTLTAILGVSHPAFVLLDLGEQQRRVSGWGRVLAAACRSGRIARIQVSERTLPDSGTGLAEWWRTHSTDDGSWAATTYAELIDRAGPAGERHATTISLALDMKAAARQISTSGGGIRGAAAVLRQEMSTLTTALRAAELTSTGWLTPGEVAVVLRSAYDPAAAPALERHGDLGRDLATAGPVAVTETWDRLRSDSAHHAVLWITEWPRSQVYPGFLAPLVLSNGILRTLALHYTPVRADQAARDLRKKKTELISDAAQRRKIGQIDDAASSAELDDVLQQEADLTAGHGVLRVSGLVSVSAPTVDELDAAVAAVEQAAIQASCETRRLVGQQAQSFTAAALPLCRPV
ncbi:SCO6880 family protein [Protaetiibacter intestinalis]|uniref:PrgI family protein n=1 Tax=Protaetiibacter intestinalis TaxID=2419774 RepID=A0A387B6C3_9MICO|nr:SCO6880 family protein [Protaetiibacter intestinalis]AYF99304.1 PrgI family protein [Protaetiibacter intestinalis]